MTNHPNRNRTYWLKFPRNFANEYTVGIASTREDAEQYEAEGFRRIDRDRALRLMSDHGDNATQLYATTSLDGEQCYDRFEVARAIRTGRDISL
jgi:hypothetical protein